LIENSETPLKHIILVALNTRMRKAEILNLEWNQVNLEEGFIRIEAQRSKNRKIRVIPLNNSMKEVFYKLHYGSNDSQYVFENPKTGKAFVCINRRWRTLLKDLGIKGFSFHDLRHTFATYALLKKAVTWFHCRRPWAMPISQQLPGTPRPCWKDSGNW
jgi:integrase